jgi:mono/diheme cytochrome c family protein
MKKSSLFILFILTFFVFSCAEKKEEEKDPAKAQIEGYYEGKALFEAKCVACHQKSGEPSVKLYPPLKNSDYLRNNPAKIACIIRNGVNEDLTVNGQEYKIKMQGFNALSAQEISQIYNYINNSWGNDYGTKSTDEVIEDLKNCN